MIGGSQAESVETPRPPVGNWKNALFVHTPDYFLSVISISQWIPEIRQNKKKIVVPCRTTVLGLQLKIA